MWNIGFLVSPKWMHQNLLKHFRRGTQMTRTSPTAYNRYGIALYNSGEFEKALSAFSSAVLKTEHYNLSTLNLYSCDTTSSSFSSLE